MKLLQTLIIALALVAAGLGVGYASVTRYDTNDAVNRGRACAPVAGAAEEVTATTAASDASGALAEDSLYLLKCDSEAYVRWCATSSCTAAAGDFKLPADAVLPFTTKTSGVASSGPLYMAAKSVSVSGSCWLLECR